MKSRRPILCLDIATTFGWAKGLPGEKPIIGSKRAAPPGASPGEILAGFAGWLNEELKTFPPAAVYYEGFLDPRQLGGKTNKQTMFVLISLAGMCEFVCHSRGIWNCNRADQNTIRKHFVGKGRGGQDIKALVMRQCDALGWEYPDNNGADAAALFSYASSLLAPESALALTPLFSGNSVGEQRIRAAVAKDDARRAAERLFSRPGMIEEIPE